MDTAATALRMAPDEAHAKIGALQTAFELSGNPHSFDETVRIVINALKRRKPDDPDVCYALEWLRSIVPQSPL